MNQINVWLSEASTAKYTSMRRNSQVFTENKAAGSNLVF